VLTVLQGHLVANGHLLRQLLLLLLIWLRSVTWRVDWELHFGGCCSCALHEYGVGAKNGFNTFDRANLCCLGS
jgi:hypothetical protein